MHAVFFFFQNPKIEKDYLLVFFVENGERIAGSFLWILLSPNI